MIQGEMNRYPQRASRRARGVMRDRRRRGTAVIGASPVCAIVSVAWSGYLSQTAWRSAVSWVISASMSRPGVLVQRVWYLVRRATDSL